jgi:hypothetical protein
MELDFTFHFSLKLTFVHKYNATALLGNCNICVKQKISVINERNEMKFC